MPLYTWSSINEAAQVSTIEFSLVEKDILFGLKQGNEVLKELNTQMSIENVEKLMGETADAVAYQRVRYLYSQSCRALQK